MRESMELAFVCAKLQGSGKSPIFTHIDDIHFIRPVEIGSTIRYSAWMTYCRNRIANVKVIVERLDKQGDTL